MLVTAPFLPDQIEFGRRRRSVPRCDELPHWDGAGGEMMQTYFCYIHIRGLLAPTMRILEASSDDAVSRQLIDSLRDWPALETIEFLEIYDEHQLPLCSLNVGNNTPMH